MDGQPNKGTIHKNLVLILFLYSVHYMESRLDPEKIGIILLENFLKEFFPYPVRE